MLRIIPKGKLSASLLSGIVVLGIWGNVIAASLCPHMSGKHDCCRGQTRPRHSHENMAGMDMPDMQMDGMQMSEKDMADSQREDVPVENTPQARQDGEAFTLPTEMCAHCLLHSPSNATRTMRDVAQANKFSEQISAPFAERMVESVFFIVAPPICRDHSPPPGTGDSRHLLINVFRI